MRFKKFKRLPAFFVFFLSHFSWAAPFFGGFQEVSDLVGSHFSCRKSVVGSLNVPSLDLRWTVFDPVNNAQNILVNILPLDEEAGDAKDLDMLK